MCAEKILLVLMGGQAVGQACAETAPAELYLCYSHTHKLETLLVSFGSLKLEYEKADDHCSALKVDQNINPEEIMKC